MPLFNAPLGNLSPSLQDSLRCISRTKTIQGSHLVQFVESFRNAGSQPCQRVVVSPSDAAMPELEKPAVARAAEKHLAGHSELLPAELSEEAAG